MAITIWSFFTILIGQALCFPGFDLRFSNNAALPKEFLEDLKKLMSEEDTSIDNKAMKEMISGLLNHDLSKRTDQQQIKMSENPSKSSSSYLTGQLFPGELKSPNAGQRFFNDSLTNPNLQSDTSSEEIKSLAEWARLDKMGVKSTRQKQHIPSLENLVQGSISSLQGDVKDDQIQPDNQITKNQSTETDLVKTPALINQANGIQSAVKSNQLEDLSISEEKQFDPKLKNALTDEHIHNPGYYESSVGWVKLQKDTKKVSPEEDEDEHKTSSFTDSLLSKLNIQYWKDIDWSEYFPNPFA